jgi:hypothetical protein
MRLDASCLRSRRAPLPPQRHADQRRAARGGSGARCGRFRGCASAPTSTRAVSRCRARGVQPNTPFAILTHGEDTITAQDSVVSLPVEPTPISLFGLRRLAARKG